MNDHSVPENQTLSLFLSSLLFLSVLAIMRVAFCIAMPNIIGGWRVLNSDLDIALLCIPFVFAGYYFLIVRPHITIGMLAVTPGLTYISAISTYRLQVDIFHFGRHFPLIDDSLGSMDAALGFNWVNYFNFITTSGALFQVISIAYQSIWVQPLVLFIALSLKNRVREYFTLQCALPLSFGLSCGIAALFPALGAYQFHGMSNQRHDGISLEFTDQMTAPIMWLRQYTLPDLLPAFPDMRLITFPSWHAAAAIIFILAAWPVRGLRYAALGLNILMLMATPVQGSHYLTDMIIGASLGFISMYFAKLIVSTQYFALLFRNKLSDSQKEIPA